jgi:hypothetical protein
MEFLIKKDKNRGRFLFTFSHPSPNGSILHGLSEVNYKMLLHDPSSNLNHIFLQTMFQAKSKSFLPPVDSMGVVLYFISLQLIFD